MAQKDEELKLLRQQVATMQDALKAIQEPKKAQLEAPMMVKSGKKKGLNSAMLKRI